MLDAVQGRDTSVRGTISKGRFVQGAQHPRIFDRGHIGRGHINPASNVECCESSSLSVEIRTQQSGSIYPWDPSFKGQFIPGMMSKGRIIPMTHCIVQEQKFRGQIGRGHIIMTFFSLRILFPLPILSYPPPPPPNLAPLISHLRPIFARIIFSC
jgi:hypothetical protein